MTGMIPTTQNMGNPAIQPAAAMPNTTVTGSSVPGLAPTGVMPSGISPIGSDGFRALYGNDTGNAVAQLFNSMTPGTANSLAQQIINANVPNVMAGQANLRTNLAASGIGPSSSVSAIENANYMAGVNNNNLSTMSQFNMDEQQMQLRLLLSLLPGQQQREAETSGWSIFNNVMQGIGDVGDLIGAIPTGGMSLMGMHGGSSTGDIAASIPTL